MIKDTLYTNIYHAKYSKLLDEERRKLKIPNVSLVFTSVVKSKSFDSYEKMKKQLSILGINLKVCQQLCSRGCEEKTNKSDYST